MINVKLIVTDLDNTLLNSEHIVPKSSVELIKKVTDQGVTVAVATGRSFASAAGVAKDIGSTCPAICYNGAQIKAFDGNPPIFSSFVPSEVQRGITEFVKARGLYMQIYDNDEIVVEKLKPECHPDPDLKYASYRETGDIDELSRIKTPKLLIAAKPAEIPSLQAELEAIYGDKAYFAQSEAHLIEVMEKGVNKGAALDTLAKRLGIKKHEIIAVGDNTNDAMLLSHAGFSVAVANAVDSLKETADYICKGERSEGFNEALRKFVL